MDVLDQLLKKVGAPKEPKGGADEGGRGRGGKNSAQRVGGERRGEE